ncbi:MAG: tryptophan synthase subunit alpha [Salinivirgaceae bacterium]
MNRINELFNTKNKNILSVYFTAGYPEPETTVEIIKELEANGADMIEIGIPFSDPLADGPVIQQSSQQALARGMSLKKLLSELTSIRQNVKIPLLLMGYFNVILNYGVESFCETLEKIGVDGVIIPDLPLEVYESSYAKLFQKHGIIPVFLITPGTDETRIRKTEALSKGFIYLVSSASTTGTKTGFDQSSIDYFKRIASMNLKVPVLTGFGISNQTTFKQASEYSSGAIVGSALIKALDEPGSLSERIQGFIRQIRN